MVRQPREDRPAALLEVQELSCSFPVRGHRDARLRAVDGVSLELERGEVLGLVGESGCGKTTLARLLLRLETPASGRVRFAGEDALALRGNALLRYRRQVQAVFQDPGTSLNARHRVGRIVAEGLRVHGLCRRAEEQARVGELLDLVGLAPEVQGRFPHQLAGGQRQRVAIARALAVEPALLICDEPVSSLDVSLRAQVLNLFHELRARLRLSILFISHDLSAVRAISHRVAVMYLGRIVEVGPVEAVFSRPGHPYTQALLAAVPRFPPERDRGVLRLRDEPPRGLAPPPGCAFHPRCPVAEPRCSRELPPRQAPGPRHEFLCIHAYATPPHPARGG